MPLHGSIWDRSHPHVILNLKGNLHCSEAAVSTYTVLQEVGAAGGTVFAHALQHHDQHELSWEDHRPLHGWTRTGSLFQIVKGNLFGILKLLFPAQSQMAKCVQLVLCCLCHHSSSLLQEPVQASGDNLLRHRYCLS